MDPLKLLKIKTVMEWYSTNTGISLMAASKNFWSHHLGSITDHKKHFLQLYIFTILLFSIYSECIVSILPSPAVVRFLNVSIFCPERSNPSSTSGNYFRMLVIIVCRDSKGRLSLRPAVDQPGCAHRHLRLETDWVTMALVWAAMMEKWRVLPFARLHPWFWGVGGLPFHFILSTEILDKTRSPLARDKINGKFRPAPPPPPPKKKHQRRENGVFCPLHGFILYLRWGRTGVGCPILSV